MTTQALEKNRQAKTEEFIKMIFDKYVKRQNIYEPLSKILPNHWNDIFLTAVKQTMFKKIKPLNDVVKKDVWILSSDVTTVKEIAEKVIQKEKELRTMIWSKNGWGNPYPAPQPERLQFQYKETNMRNEIVTVSFEKFRGKYFPILAMKMSDEDAQLVVRSIYKLINDVAGTYYREGISAANVQIYNENVDKLVDIYNNIELNLGDLKKIIDQ